MATHDVEELLYGGEPASDRLAYQRYLADVHRGKSLLQLQAVAAGLTPEVRRHWSPRSFTPVRTPTGEFDAVVCNVAYHFHKHGQRYGTVARMTEAALRAYREHQREKVRRADGLWKLPDGSLFEPDGRIVTFVG
jgi:hypothetical protein